MNCKKCKIEITEKHQVESNLKTHANKYKENYEMYKNKAKLIEQDISDIEAKENRELIIKNFKSFNDNPEEVNMGQIWKLMKKLWPKHENILPVAKQNHLGKIVSGPNDIKPF